MIHVELDNGEQIELPAGANGAVLGKTIKKKLAGKPLAINVNGVLKDLSSELQDGDKVALHSFEDDTGRDVFWHSAAHVLAQAVQRLYPDAQPTIGPPIDNGFYYDFAKLSISEKDFASIEAEVKTIISERHTPERIEFSDQATALQFFSENPFKTEMIENLQEGLSAYRQGEFVDLCRGPHLPNLNLIQGFKILKTSGAYWRGDQQKEQLTRIYATAFPDKKMLSKYLQQLEEAKKRDHRVIGKRLNLFSFSEEAPGMPFIFPNGKVIWDELLKLWEEQHQQHNYLNIKTPLMMDKSLWIKSGHWQNYGENMYSSNIDERDYCIKPMNCPGCMMFYKKGQYSYKQLPLRVAEIGNVHRHEFSGALSGLFRVRSFHQDDAHIFMRPQDIEAEILGVLQLAEQIYAQFGLSFTLELSTRPEKSIGSDAQWEMAESGLRSALEQKYPYTTNPGDGAFYGPKIDIHIKDAIGRSWQCGTIQLDMSLPDRFDLQYIDSDGERKRPVMIHRVVYGSMERFLGILIEHYAGKFPLWLSPRQVRLLPIADVHRDFAQSVAVGLQQAGLRVEVDDAMDSISKRVRTAQLDQVNYILVVGDQEIANKQVAVRARSGKMVGALDIAEFTAAVSEEYRTRSQHSVFEQ